jgi:GxxExxY protein
MIEEKYKYSAITEKIIGCAMEVHKFLGNGFTHLYCLFLKGIRECFAFQEVIYQRSLEIEFILQGVKFHREYDMKVYYKNRPAGIRRVDFLVEDVISVEIKAHTKLEDVHFAQAINYLEAYNLEIGLLINFGARSLEFHRLTNSKYESSKPYTGNRPAKS